MDEMILSSATFGVVISLVFYGLGVLIKTKTGKSIFNPLLISIILVMAVLSVGRIDYSSYYQSAQYLSYLLTPATVALAIPLYMQLDKLKKNIAAILVGILCGCLTSMGSILVMSIAFHLTHEQYVTLLPKSITTAIGMSVAKELGGYETIAVAVIIVTGILGNIAAEAILKFCRVTDPIAKGVAIGTASHAIGTSKAMQMGELEGAMSSLALVVSGIITVVMASFFAMLY